VQSKSAIEWGIKLIESIPKDQWIISEMKEFEIEYGLTSINHHKGPYFSLQGGEKIVSFSLTTKD
jgi:hypothetical protein